MQLRSFLLLAISAVVTASPIANPFETVDLSDLHANDLHRRAATTIEHDARYIIMNVNSRTVLDLDNGNRNDGAIIHAMTCPNLRTPQYSQQIWRTLVDKGAWRLVNVASATSMDLVGGRGNNGNAIGGYYTADTDNQRWYILPINTPGQVVRHTIRNIRTTTYVEVPGGNKADGTKIQAWEYTYDGNQDWIFIPVA